MVTVSPGQKVLAAHVNAKFDKDGSSQMSGNIIPDTNNSYDIGSNTGPKKWKDLYLAGTLYGVGATLTGTLNGADIVLSGNITINGGSIFLGVLLGDPGSPSTGQIWFNSTDKQFKGYNGVGIVILG